MRKMRTASAFLALISSASSTLTILSGTELSNCAVGNLEQGKTGYFYDSTQFKCMPCGLNAVQDTSTGQNGSSGTSCKCEKGYAKNVNPKNEDYFNFKFSCTKCQAVSVLFQYEACIIFRQLRPKRRGLFEF